MEAVKSLAGLSNDLITGVALKFVSGALRFVADPRETALGFRPEAVLTPPRCIFRLLTLLCGKLDQRYSFS